MAAIPAQLRTKRWDDPVSADDGYRLLVCRYRPRGVKREREPWDAWCAALAPSVELHAERYGKTGAVLPWPDYARRYLREMERQRFWIEGFAARVKAGEPITLLCSSACVDPAICHRTLLARLLVDAAFPPEPSSLAARSIVRRR
jgi:uncharacterized protein YeaO (DUF488 family)